MKNWKRKAIPDLITLVRKGWVGVPVASRIADEPKEMQDVFVCLVTRAGIKPSRAEKLVYETIDFIVGEAGMSLREASKYVSFMVEHGGFDESYWR